MSLLSEIGFWTTIDRQTYLSTLTSAQRITIILDKYNIMIEMQKLKFMQEFISAINVECLHSRLQAMTVHVQNMQKQVL